MTGVDLMAGLLGGAAGGDGRFFGVVTGVVTNNQDPDKMGRVKVKFPWLSEDVESAWARLATPGAGASCGLFMLPEVDDEVLVAFEHGRMELPYVLGSLWNGQDAPPETDDGANNLRLLKSRSGHVVRLDDTDGEEKIEIVDKSGKNTIVVDTANNAVTVTADADVTVTATNGKLSLHGKTVAIESDGELTLEAGGELKAKASGAMKLSGTTMDLD